MSVTTLKPARRFRIERLEERIAPGGVSQAFCVSIQVYFNNCFGGDHFPSYGCGNGAHGSHGGHTPPPPPPHGSHGGHGCPGGSGDHGTGGPGGHGPGGHGGHGGCGW